MKFKDHSNLAELILFADKAIAFLDAVDEDLLGQNPPDGNNEDEKAYFKEYRTAAREAADALQARFNEDNYDVDRRVVGWLITLDKSLPRALFLARAGEQKDKVRRHPIQAWQYVQNCLHNIYMECLEASLREQENT